MTEEQIERSVERKINALDARFMTTNMPQAEYDAAIKQIHEWADREYRFRDREVTGGFAWRDCQ